MKNSATATLCFAENTGETLVNWPSEAGGRVEQREGVYHDHLVTIENARSQTGRLSLDREGFILTQQSSGVSNYYDHQQVTEIYEPELKQLLIDQTGAEKVVVFDHTRRAGDADLRATKTVREPVQLVHSDYTERSGPQKLRDFLPSTEADLRKNRRFAIINVWRSMQGPIESFPLALCDAGSVEAGDLITVERRSRDRVGEIFYLAHNPNQRWCYFPELQASEALVFKCFDSALDGRARMSPHTAFEDPESPPDAAPRQSIESRCLVLF